MRIIKVKKVSDGVPARDREAEYKMPFVKQAIASAKSVLAISKKGKRGEKARKAISAAEAWVKNPTLVNKEKANVAAQWAHAGSFPPSSYSRKTDPLADAIWAASMAAWGAAEAASGPDALWAATAAKDAKEAASEAKEDFSKTK